MRTLVIGVVAWSVAIRADADSAVTRSEQRGVVVDVGLSTSHIDLSHRDVHGEDASQHVLVMSARPLGSLQAETIDIDVGYRIGAFYIGTELRFGRASAAHGLPGEPPALFGITGGGFEPELGAGIAIGAELVHIASLSARVELYGGGLYQILAPDAASRANYPCDDESCEGPYISSRVLEPRLRVGARLCSWMSLDGWAGVGVGPSQGDWSFGVTATLHGLSGSEVLAAVTGLLATAPLVFM